MDWDEFLERWYAPVAVYLVSVGISFFWIVLLIGGLDLVWLTFSFVLSLFGGAVLNELRWRDPNRLPDAVIVYRDRARLEGFRTIRGSEIVELQRRYFTTAGARLPYYKIERIEVSGRIQFQRGTVERRARRTSGP